MRLLAVCVRLFGLWVSLARVLTIGNGTIQSLPKQIAIDRLQGEMFRRAWGEKRFKHLEDGQPIVDPETGEPYFELVYDTQALIHVLGRLL